MKSTSQSGLSLVEILVTLGIVSLLMGVAVPQFQTLVARNKVQALMDELASSLYLARGEAAKRGFYVTMCASNTEKTECDTSATDFSSGWIIFVDYDANGVLGAPTLLFDTTGDGVSDTAEEILHVSNVSSGGTHQVQSTRGRLIGYSSDGLVTSFQVDEMKRASNAGFSIVKSGETTELAEVNINGTGRIYSKYIGVDH